MLDLLKTADWLTPDRVAAWSTVLLIEEVLILLFLALWEHGLFMRIDNPASSDFVSFYAAGKLALAGTPALAYDQAAHYLAQQQATFAGAHYQYFFYPPVFLLLCTVLAKLPYLVAFAVFQLATLVPFILVMRAVLRGRDWRWVPPLLAFPAVFWTLGLGQNAFLTAALFGGFTLLIDRRPVSAGMLLGMLCYKPHFGLLAPIALVAGGRWKAFCAALATVAALVAISIVAFGWDTWAAYLNAFAGSNTVYESGRIDFAEFITPFGGIRLLGFAATPAYVVQAGSALIVAAFTALVWQRRMSQPLRCACLLTATLLAVPLALLYDKMLLLVAIGWLVREARARGFLPWEKLVLLLTYPASLVSWLLGLSFHMPVAPMISCAVLTLCIRRVWRELAARPQAIALTPSRLPPSLPLAGQPFGATP